MVHRFFLWVVAGVLSLWISIAMVAAPGVALATPGPGSDSGGAESAEQAKPAKSTKPTKRHKASKTSAEKKAAAGSAPSGGTGTAKGRPSTTDPKEFDPQPGGVANAEQEHVGAVPATSGGTVDEDVNNNTKEAVAPDNLAADRSGSEEATTPEPVAKVAGPRANISGTGGVRRVAETLTDPGPPADPITVEDTTALATTSSFDTVDPVTEKTSASRVVTFAAAAPATETVQGKPTLLNVIGTLVFSVLDFVTKIIDGPPSVPAGSTVTVGRSKLQIDCGDGYSVDADWYFPTGDEEPVGLIYLQHGFGARGGFYNVTAAELAEQTHSIVVAPSITSNLFACDSCHVAGDPMHYAVAKLFSADREALTASASAAAGYDVVLPQQYVIAGHSEGGQLAAGVAGYAAQIAEVNGTPLDLAGVLLYDTSEVGGAVSRGIAKIPTDIPVLYLTAEPGILNDYGSVDAVLEDLRPGQFNGVRLTGGTHSDPLRTSNPLVDIGFKLLTGVPRPENVEATQLLAGGWIRDMFAGTVYDEDERTGIYGDLGTLIDIPTDSGTAASAYVLPAPPHTFTLIDLFLQAFIESTNGLRFGYCAVDPDVEIQQGADVARSSQPSCSV